MTLPVEPVPVVVIIWKCSVPLTAVWVLAAASPAPPSIAAAAVAVRAEMIIFRIAGSPSGANAAGGGMPRVWRPGQRLPTPFSLREPVCPHIGSDAYSGLR